MKLKFAAVVAISVGSFFAGPAMAQDLEWTLINNTGVTLMEFYTSPTTSDNWDQDLLGSGTLEAGGTGTVTIADGESVCDYDLRFVFEDGSALEDTVNMCEMGSYTLE